LGYYAVFRWVGLYHLELDCSHATTDKESVALANGTIGFEEIRFEVNIENISTKTLDRVVEWKNMDTFAIFDVKTLVYDSNVAKFDSQIIASDLVHLDFALFNIIRAETDKDRIASFLSTDYDRVSPEQLEGFHCCGIKGSD